MKPREFEIMPYPAATQDIGDVYGYHFNPNDRDPNGIHVREVIPGTVTITCELAESIECILLDSIAHQQCDGHWQEAAKNLAAELERAQSPDKAVRE